MTGAPEVRRGDPSEVIGVHRLVLVVRRRWWVVVLATVLTPFVAFLFSQLQIPKFSASASVLIASDGSTLGNLVGAYAGVPERNAATQVALARLPAVAAAVTRSELTGETPQAFLDRSSVSAATNADILDFAVVSTDARQAKSLATRYASAYTRYRSALDREAVASARASIQRQLGDMARQGRKGSALYVQLRASDQQLAASQAARGAGAVVVQPAVESTQVSPHPKRDLLVGIVLGVLLGVGLAFLLDTVDTRVRGAEEIEDLVGLPCLGKLPEPPALTGGEAPPVAMLQDAAGSYSEAVRTLRANLEFSSLGTFGNYASLMVTSALGGEGKSTTAANLAVAFAKAGRRVILCDLDARAPAQADNFGLRGHVGLVDVVLGDAVLNTAVTSIAIDPESLDYPDTTQWMYLDSPDGNGQVVPKPGTKRTTRVSKPAGVMGSLHVLQFGSKIPANPGDFVGSAAVRELLTALAGTHDLVIIDTPPLLAVSDALVVSERVDALLVVARLDAASRTELREVRRLVDASPARGIGLVVTGVESRPGYGYHAQTQPGSAAAEVVKPKRATPRRVP